MTAVYVNVLANVLAVHGRYAELKIVIVFQRGLFENTVGTLKAHIVLSYCQQQFILWSVKRLVNHAAHITKGIATLQTILRTSGLGSSLQPLT
jgi:hypothetical protein